MNSKTKLIVVALALMTCCAGAWAHGSHGGHGGWGRSGVRVGVHIGGPWWGPWWGVPAYSYHYSPAPVVIQRSDPPMVIEAGSVANYWYFCRSANAYYPYVKECPNGWERVTPTPAQ